MYGSAEGPPRGVENRNLLSHPDDLAIGSLSSGWLMANVLCHPDDIRSFPMSSGWHNVSWFLCHPDEIAPSRISSGWLMTNAGCHPDDLWCCLMSSGWDNYNLIPKSSGWLSYSQYLIRMTYRRCICHPDDLPGVGISSGWVTANSLCHPDDILFHFMSSGWLNWGWFLIRMSYGNVIMSSGWDTLPFLSHPDEIANFDFPQHAVALQRFRNNDTIFQLCKMISKPSQKKSHVMKTIATSYAPFQTTFSSEFSWMKMYEFRLRFHWNLFLGFELTIFHHWFR